MSKCRRRLVSCFMAAIVMFSMLAMMPAKTTETQAGDSTLSYHVYGSLYAYDSGGGDVIKRQIPAGAATAISDSATSSGTKGSHAQSAYYANLATGSLGTYIHGYAPNANL